MVTLANTLIYTLLEEIQQVIQDDRLLGPLIQETKVQDDKNYIEKYFVVDDLLIFKKRLWIPLSWQPKSFYEARENPLATHIRYHKIFSSLKSKMNEE